MDVNLKNLNILPYIKNGKMQNIDIFIKYL
jgi:hypothetical protein